MTNPRKILGIRLSVVVAGVLGFVLGAAAVPSNLTGSAYAGKVPAAISSPLADTTFPPPIYNDLASQPSYVVNINDNGNSVSFSPQVISIPVGMTVIWFNNGADEHTVTTMATNDNNDDASSAPQTINSDLISADGGSFIYTFTQPGVYRYVDRMDPHASGIVNVGGAVEYGNNFEMHIGGLNPAQSDSHNPGNGVTLRFIPKTVSLPPDTAITYQVEVSNAKGKVFSQQFDDKDGILDLELVPNVHASSGSAASAQQHQLRQQVVSWGPDFLGEEGYGSTGTFHLQVPALSGNSHYYITITVLDKDDVPASNVSDTFAVPLLNQ